MTCVYSNLSIYMLTSAPPLCYNVLYSLAHILYKFKYIFHTTIRAGKDPCPRAPCCRGETSYWSLFSDLMLPVSCMGMPPHKIIKCLKKFKFSKRSIVFHICKSLCFCMQRNILFWLKCLEMIYPSTGRYVGICLWSCRQTGCVSERQTEMWIPHIPPY